MRTLFRQARPGFENLKRTIPNTLALSVSGAAKLAQAVRQTAAQYLLTQAIRKYYPRIQLSPRKIPEKILSPFYQIFLQLKTSWILDSSLFSSKKY